MIGRNGRETFFSRFFLATTAIMNSFGLTLDWHVNRIRGHPFFLIVRCQATGFFFSTFFLIWLLFLLSKPNSIRVDSILNSNKKNIVMQLNPTSGFGLFCHFFSVLFCCHNQFSTCYGNDNVNTITLDLISRKWFETIVNNSSELRNQTNTRMQAQCKYHG